MVSSISLFVIVLIILGLTAAVALLYILLTNNKLVSLKAMIAESQSGIEVQLEKQHRLIPSLAELVQKHAASESNLIDNLLEKLNEVKETTDLPGRAGKENALLYTIKEVISLKNAYSELGKDKSFLLLQENLAEVEGDLEMARRYYNAIVRDYNTRIDAFPSGIVALLLSHKKEAYFSSNPQDDTDQGQYN